VRHVADEQEHSGCGDLRLSFGIRLFQKVRSDYYAPRTRSVETAIVFWEAMKALGKRVSDDEWQKTSQWMSSYVKAERDAEIERRAALHRQLLEDRRVQQQQLADTRTLSADSGVKLQRPSVCNASYWRARNAKSRLLNAARLVNS
jgi:hypothetical protein